MPSNGCVILAASPPDPALGPSSPPDPAPGPSSSDGGVKNDDDAEKLAEKAAEPAELETEPDNDGSGLRAGYDLYSVRCDPAPAPAGGAAGSVPEGKTTRGTGHGARGTGQHHR